MMTEPGADISAHIEDEQGEDISLEQNAQLPNSKKTTLANDSFACEDRSSVMDSTDNRFASEDHSPTPVDTSKSIGNLELSITNSENDCEIARGPECSCEKTPYMQWDFMMDNSLPVDNIAEKSLLSDCSLDDGCNDLGRKTEVTAPKEESYKSAQQLQMLCDSASSPKHEHKPIPFKPTNDPSDVFESTSEHSTLSSDQAGKTQISTGNTLQILSAWTVKEPPPNQLLSSASYDSSRLDTAECYVTQLASNQPGHASLVSSEVYPSVYSDHNVSPSVSQEHLDNSKSRKVCRMVDHTIPDTFISPELNNTCTAEADLVPPPSKMMRFETEEDMSHGLLSPSMMNYQEHCDSLPVFSTADASLLSPSVLSQPNTADYSSPGFQQYGVLSSLAPSMSNCQQYNMYSKPFLSKNALSGSILHMRDSNAPENLLDRSFNEQSAGAFDYVSRHQKPRRRKQTQYVTNESGFLVSKDDYISGLQRSPKSEPDTFQMASYNQDQGRPSQAAASASALLFSKEYRRQCGQQDSYFPMDAAEKKEDFKQGSDILYDISSEEKENQSLSNVKGGQVLSTWKVHLSKTPKPSENVLSSLTSLGKQSFDRTPHPVITGKYVAPSVVAQDKDPTRMMPKYISHLPGQGFPVLSTGTAVCTAQNLPPITPLSTIVTKQAQLNLVQHSIRDCSSPLASLSLNSPVASSDCDCDTSPGTNSTPNNTPVHSLATESPPLPTASQLTAALFKVQDNSSLSDGDMDLGRHAHNAKERARRARIKHSCENLRDIVPGMNVKTDKATVFEFAVQYIAFLRRFVGIQYDKEFLRHCSPY